MRKFASYALSFVAAFTMLGTLCAQEYAPLVQKDVTSIVRVNLNKLDPERLGAQVEKLGAAAIDYFAPEMKNADDFKKALPTANLFISRFHKDYVAPLTASGVANVYFFASVSSNGDSVFPYAAIPIKLLNDDQLDAVRALLKKVNRQVEESISYRFERDGFFFLPIIPENVSKSSAQDYVDNYFAKIEAVDPELFVEGFKAVDADDAVISGVSIMNSNHQLLQDQKERLLKVVSDIDDDDDDDLIVAAKDLLKFTAEFGEKESKLIEYSAWAINVDKLELVSLVQANSRDDAKSYLELVESELLGKINNFIDACERRAVRDIDRDDDRDELNEAEIKTLASAFKELLPILLAYDRDGARLVKKLDGKFFDANKGKLQDFAQKIADAYKKLQRNAIDEMNDELYDD